MSIKNAPGHRTDSMDAPPAPKTTITAIVENRSKLPVNVGGAVVRPGRRAAIRNWQHISQDEVVRRWLAVEGLVVLEEREIEPEPPEEIASDPTARTAEPEREPAYR